MLYRCIVVPLFAVMLLVDVLDAELGRIIEVRVAGIKVRRRSGDEQCFDDFCRAAFPRKQAA